MGHEPVPADIEGMARTCVNAAFRVHNELGPELLESVYETCLEHELRKAGIAVQRQIDVPVGYDGIRMVAGLRIDLLLGGKLIVELKAVEKMLPVHTAQVMTYLKLTGNRLGLLINFNVPLIKDGIRRVIID